MRTNHRLYLIVLALVVTLLAACGANRESALDKSTDDLVKATSQGELTKAVAEGDEMWAGRLDRAKLEGAITKWEAAASMTTEGMSEAQRRQALYDLHVKLTRAYYFLGDSHVRLSGGDEDALETEMKVNFNKGVTAAEKALAIYSPEFAKAVRFDTPMPEAIKLLDKGAAGAMYWYATNMGKWALLEGFTEILSRKDNIKAIMDKVEADDPMFFYGGPLRYFGAYYTKLPFPGGDLEKSKTYFDKAVAAAPSYLATRVLIADMHATKADNPKLFDEQIKAVLEYDLSQDPDLAPENEFEQRKAKKLMEKRDDLF